MPKPSRNQLHSFRLFELRQQRYEKKYIKYFLSYLSTSYRDAATQYKQTGVFDFSVISQNGKLENILTRLYKEVIIKEATIAYNEVLEPLEGNRLKTKDVITDLINILSPNNRGLINLWQSLLDTFIQVRLTNKITQINNTTNERISRIIEQGMFDGMGQEEVAREIRKQARGEFNINRARNIARTETTCASNQGKYLNAKSSNIILVKKWIPSNDQRNRLSHRDMLDREWIGIDEMFWVANADGYLEQALYPTADTLSASNIINCRCSVVFQPLRDISGRVITKM